MYLYLKCLSIKFFVSALFPTFQSMKLCIADTLILFTFYRKISFSMVFRFAACTEFVLRFFFLHKGIRMFLFQDLIDIVQ